MPIVNIYYENTNFEDQLIGTCSDLKVFVAEKLSGEDITLVPDEVSVRLLTVAGPGMLADVELEIIAHAFDARVNQQDEICLEVRDFLKGRLRADEIRVWLLLPQLGHSWE